MSVRLSTEDALIVMVWAELETEIGIACLTISERLANSGIEGLGVTDLRRAVIHTLSERSTVVAGVLDEDACGLYPMPTGEWLLWSSTGGSDEWWMIDDTLDPQINRTQLETVYWLINRLDPSDRGDAVRIRMLYDMRQQVRDLLDQASEAPGERVGE